MSLLECLKEYWEAIIAGSALLISIVSLLVSMVSVKNQRDSAKRQKAHFMMSVRPHVYLKVKGFSLTEAGGFTLKNGGIGPAFIKKVAMYDSKTKLEHSPMSFSAEHIEPFDQTAGSGLASPGLVIPKGEEYQILYFEVKKDNLQRLVDLFERYHIKIDYTDMYESEIWSTTEDFISELKDQLKYIK